jgi:hypothetical protein
VSTIEGGVQYAVRRHDEHAIGGDRNPTAAEAAGVRRGGREKEIERERERESDVWA